MQSKAAVQI